MQSSKPDTREQIPVETSAGTGEPQPRKTPDPMTADLLRERKKIAESDLRTGETIRAPAGGRVADAGDASGGPTTAYDLETQADSISRQGRRVTGDEVE
ncbi:hypothetical protein [Rhizobium sp. CSW-27]|uniref:hypothetical protein n=1 Tax=Rhizobium sp. CSW-27 TaxID=2839985 RepID=UPI001C009847|nr:hypothetical protein [Rhizobium sp. CSW-27]MBT9369062.1 hypothetical protein [Rhizobium sp. CSW-27]